MRLTRIVLSAVTMVAIGMAFFSCQKPAVDDAALMKKANEIFQPLPATAPGSDKDSPELIALGNKLYHDPILSINNTQSCATCHTVDGNKAGVDNKPTSTGAKGDLGGRNSPTVLNSAFHIAQFWDGRAPTLEEQAKGPILNPVEMAMPDAGAVVKKLNDNAEYRKLFADVFKNDKNPLTYDHVALAIAAFERTLITKDRFDDFLKGDATALSEQEKKGLEIFIGNGCTACHDSVLLGANKYMKIGLVNPYPTPDTGRFQVTKAEIDKYVFKVPSLRNVALTYPYFHNGSINTLGEAVRLMGHHQLGKTLSDEDVNLIVAFLNTLSDKSRKTN